MKLIIALLLGVITGCASRLDPTAYRATLNLGVIGDSAICGSAMITDTTSGLQIVVPSFCVPIQDVVADSIVTRFVGRYKINVALRMGRDSTICAGLSISDTLDKMMVHIPESCISIDALRRRE